MFRNLIKKLPIIRLLHRIRVLERERALLAQQLNASIAHIESQHHHQLNTSSVDCKNNSALNFNDEFIVSLTSYGERVTTVHHTILSLLCQTVRPQRVYLWLSQEEFNDESLPQELKQLGQFGLEVKYCEDTRSYKKLIPTLALHQACTIITFDDDVIYPNDHIEKLLIAAQKHPNTVICHLAHRFAFKGIRHSNEIDAILPYKKWPSGISEAQPGKDVYPVGVGGVLYPPNCFDQDVLNQQQFMKLCPYADDVWFKLMALKNGTLTKVLDNPMPYSEYLHIPRTQDVSLWQINTLENDKQIRAVLKAYPEISFGDSICEI